MNWKYLPEYPPLNEIVLISSTSISIPIPAFWIGQNWLTHIIIRDQISIQSEDVYAWCEMPEKAVERKFYTIVVLQITLPEGRDIMWIAVKDAESYRNSDNYVCTFKAQLMLNPYSPSKGICAIPKLGEMGFTTERLLVKVEEIIHTK